MSEDDRPQVTGGERKSALRGSSKGGLKIRYDRMRLNKPLSEITAADVPPGFDPEDVASDFAET